MPLAGFKIQTFHNRARKSLRRFAQGTILAISVTSILFMIFSAEAQSTSSNSISDSSSQSAVEATTTLNELLRSSISFLPKLLIATAIFIAFYRLFFLIKTRGRDTATCFKILEKNKSSFCPRTD